MATKKGAKKKSPKREKPWTPKEKAVFRQLGVGEGEVSLRRLIRGQRRINGKLYDSIDLILAHLKKQARGSKAATPELEAAEKLNDLVPSADPPKCESGPGPGTGG
jgi:hypothetical protein